MSFNLDEDYAKRWIDKADLKRQKAECSICRKLKTFAVWRVKTGAPVCERCKKAKREAQRMTGARHQTVRRITQTPYCRRDTSMSSGFASNITTLFTFGKAINSCNRAV